MRLRCREHAADNHVYHNNPMEDEMARKPTIEQKQSSNSPNGLVDRGAAKPDPVKTEGTTEVPVYSTSDDRQARYEEMEKQKEKDIKKLEKESDGEPKV